MSAKELKAALPPIKTVWNKLQNGEPIKIRIGEPNDESEITLTREMESIVREALSKDLNAQFTAISNAIRALEKLEQS